MLCYRTQVHSGLSDTGYHMTSCPLLSYMHTDAIEGVHVHIYTYVHYAKNDFSACIMTTVIDVITCVEQWLLLHLPFLSPLPPLSGVKMLLLL